MRSLEEPVTRTTGALLCFPEEHSLPRRYLTDDARARPDRQVGVRSVQLLYRALPALPPGPPDRAAHGHARSPVQPGGRLRWFSAASSAASATSARCTPARRISFPRTPALDNKHMMRAKGLEHPDLGRTDVRPHSMQEYRHVPVASLIKKLGLSGFRNVGELTECSLATRGGAHPAQATRRAARGSRCRSGATRARIGGDRCGTERTGRARPRIDRRHRDQRRRRRGD